MGSEATALGEGDEMSQLLDSAMAFWMRRAAEEDMPEVCAAAEAGTRSVAVLRVPVPLAPPALALEAAGDGGLFFLGEEVTEVVPVVPWASGLALRFLPGAEAAAIFVAAAATLAFEGVGILVAELPDVAATPAIAFAAAALLV